MKTKQEYPKQSYNVVENKVLIANELLKKLDMNQLQETIKKARAKISK
ncbi:hypothetical protein [Runella limosa]|nr:hypothetical protein [Runella limosa]